ncbi:reactive intermediate deaminase A [Acrasis kona]|uniref:Reactive intermediate deaminase A n=1 Tax=Acrasis kona TaxID=1008807 RepID=A0AAW2ZEH5_9EUKA
MRTLILLIAAALIMGVLCAPHKRTWRVISTDKAPRPENPRSQAIITDSGVIETSGCNGVVPSTGKMISDDLGEQMVQSMRNLGAVLEAGNASYEDVFKCTVLMGDISYYDKMNQIYGMFFNSSKLPARMAYAVREIPFKGKVEIQCSALSRD